MMAAARKGREAADVSISEGNSHSVDGSGACTNSQMSQTSYAITCITDS